MFPSRHPIPALLFSDGTRTFIRRGLLDVLAILKNADVPRYTEIVISESSSNYGSDLSR
jgi:hypothetical protein